MAPSRSSAWLKIAALAALPFALGGLTARFPDALKPACPLRAWTGLPCPTCGSLRALWHVNAGEWGAAWQLQPLGTAFYALLAVLIPAAAWAWALGFRPPSLRRPTPREGGLLVIGVMVVLLFNWAYVLACQG